MGWNNCKPYKWPKVVITCYNPTYGGPITPAHRFLCHYAIQEARSWNLDVPHLEKKTWTICIENRILPFIHLVFPWLYSCTKIWITNYSNISISTRYLLPASYKTMKTCAYYQHVPIPSISACNHPGAWLLLSFKKKQLLLWSIFDGWAFDMSNHTNLPLLYIHTYCLRLEVISSLGFPNIIRKMTSGMRFVIYVDFRDWNERFLLSQILLIPYPIRSMYGVHLPIYTYVDWVYDACRYILDLPHTQDSSHHQDDFQF